MLNNVTGVSAYLMPARTAIVSALLMVTTRLLLRLAHRSTTIEAGVSALLLKASMLVIVIAGYWGMLSFNQHLAKAICADWILGA